MLKIQIATPEGFRNNKGYWSRADASENQFEEALKIVRGIFIPEKIEYSNSHILILDVEINEGR